MHKSLSNSWFFLSPKIRMKNKELIEKYAKEYFEEIILDFPELIGRVGLCVRKYGWLAKRYPCYHIVIRRIDLVEPSRHKIRSFTSHELTHLLQYEAGVDLDRRFDKRIEKQTTFHTFKRGYAFDLLAALREECSHDLCDLAFTFNYIRCSNVFEKCCRRYKEKELARRASRLQKLSREFDMRDDVDVDSVLLQVLQSNLDT